MTCIPTCMTLQKGKQCVEERCIGPSSCSGDGTDSKWAVGRSSIFEKKTEMKEHTSSLCSIAILSITVLKAQKLSLSMHTMPFHRTAHATSAKCCATAHVFEGSVSIVPSETCRPNRSWRRRVSNCRAGEPPGEHLANGKRSLAPCCNS